jgi:hypothetical protein
LQQEHFGGPLLSAIRAGKYDSLIEKLLDRSVMQQLGYLDKKAFLEYYRYLRSDNTLTIDSPEPLSIQLWLDIELSLQATKNLIYNA